MPKKPTKSVSERVADADARGGTWLAKANELAEAGKKDQAQRCYDKGQFWLDRSNMYRDEWKAPTLAAFRPGARS